MTADFGKIKAVSAESTEAAAANEELQKRLQEADACSSLEPVLEVGVLEVLLRELNEEGRLYRESGYLSNAVEKPEELRVGTVKIRILHLSAWFQTHLLMSHSKDL